MRHIYILFLVLPVFVFGQDQNQNYVKTITYKEPSSIVQIDYSNPSHVAVQVQYFDGLGRLIQQLAHKQSGAGKDLIINTEYDEFGRQIKEYLPYVRTNTSTYFDPLGKENTMSFYGYNNSSLTGNPNMETTNNPYSEKVLELSPLSRVLEQATPGDPWEKANGKTIKFVYQTNEANEVRYFNAQTEWSSTYGLYTITLIQNGFYEKEELYKTITKDENWTSGLNNTTEEFKNKQGQVILKRTYNNGDTHDTYYVYDIYGNLTYVIPPLVDTSSTIDETTLDGLCYQYKYDYRNRLVEKKLPGKQWEFIVYNKLDKPVLTGPTYSPYGQTDLKGWLLTKYDAFGRVAYTGWKESHSIDSNARKVLQDQHNATSLQLFESKTSSTVNIDGIQVKYSNQSLPNNGFELLTVNYYDNYDYPNAPALPADIYGDVVLTNVKSLPTATWTRFLTSENETAGELTTSFYNAKGRPIGSHTINHLGGATISQSKLDFEGKALQTLTEHKKEDGFDVVRISEYFTYSPQSKLLTHLHQVNENPKELIVHNVYDELGQLISKQVGGQDTENLVGHQKVDYQYNIRGWLKSINDTECLNCNIGNFQDLFSFKIHYNTVTKKNIDTNVIEEVNDSYNNTVKKLYNGNIAETYWRTASDATLRKYSYAYDDLNRLNDAYYQKPESNIEARNSYNESLTYDKNGNIMTLIRKGNEDGDLFAYEIDNLGYKYQDKSNLLKKVTDATNESLGFKDDSDGTNDEDDDYTYDAYGNMISDQNKNITKIVYNHLNLPTVIEFLIQKK
ncbi:hypothetical protein H9X57_11275 [Flavobacterium piscinae]|uniref:DUF6443 domain-containing protein n=1 Tax=Flavobacterium piscinae TaxID=2506424 RepID=UPI0019AE556C|nr:DUF6443 domain-containing protein [Flavobacterium piscinae]MBC8883730.1 hypothetical protein [Flavobacterium piscinae]